MRIDVFSSSLSLSMYTSTLRIACLAVLAGSAYADSAIASLVAQLKQAPTANDRLALLTDEQVNAALFGAPN